MADSVKFINERDSESEPSFGINVRTKTFAAIFTGGETVSVPIGSDDNYALFQPTPGVNFLISDENPVPTVPAASDTNPMVETNVAQNVALIKLNTWRAAGKENIFITSALPQTIVVLVYK